MNAPRSVALAPLSAGVAILGIGLLAGLCGSGAVALAGSPPLGSARQPAASVVRGATVRSRITPAHVQAAEVSVHRLPSARPQADYRGQLGSGVPYGVSAGRVLPTRLTHGAASIGGAGNLRSGARGGMHDGTASLNGGTLSGRTPR